MEYLNDLDRSICEKLLDIEYFNLEISYCCSTFIINASKKGIEAFLKQYAHLEVPPPSICFQKWSRPQRVWKSRSIETNPEVLPTDPTPYMARGALNPNHLHPILHIRFLEDDSEKAIFAVGCKHTQDIIPVLTVNRKGWKKFLDILNCLLNKCYWFYVTAPRDASWNHLPFLLTDPYPGDPEEHVFLALECIRLEPEKVIYLSTEVSVLQESIWHNNIEDLSAPLTAGGYIHGNSAGLLMFSKWMHDFAISEEPSQDILNQWNDIFKSVRYGQPFESERPSPHWFHLRKICENSSGPALAFGALPDGSPDFYIFGNPWGFEELSRLTERSAFYYDHEDFFARSQKECFGGQLTKDIPAPEGIILFHGWELLEGAFFNAAYNPYSKHRFIEDPVVEPGIEIIKRFINERIYYGNNDQRKNP